MPKISEERQVGHVDTSQANIQQAANHSFLLTMMASPELLTNPDLVVNPQSSLWIAYGVCRGLSRLTLLYINQMKFANWEDRKKAIVKLSMQLPKPTISNQKDVIRLSSKEKSLLDTTNYNKIGLTQFRNLVTWCQNTRFYPSAIPTSELITLFDNNEKDAEKHLLTLKRIYPFLGNKQDLSLFISKIIFNGDIVEVVLYSASSSHAIGITLQGDNWIVHDPNYGDQNNPTSIKSFTNTLKVAEEIFAIMESFGDDGSREDKKQKTGYISALFLIYCDSLSKTKAPADYPCVDSFFKQGNTNTLSIASDLNQVCDRGLNILAGGLEAAYYAKHAFKNDTAEYQQHCDFIKFLCESKVDLNYGECPPYFNALVRGDGYLADYLKAQGATTQFSANRPFLNYMISRRLVGYRLLNNTPKFSLYASFCQEHDRQGNTPMHALAFQTRELLTCCDALLKSSIGEESHWFTYEPALPYLQKVRLELLLEELKIIFETLQVIYKASEGFRTINNKDTGTDFNCKNDQGETVLFCLIESAQAYQSIFLASEDEDSDYKVLTDLNKKIVNLFTTIVDYLLTNGANPLLANKNNKTPLDLALEQRNLMLVIKLWTFAKKTKVYKFKTTLDQFDNEGYTILHVACMKVDVEAVQVLLEMGCNPHLATKERGWTVLHFAAKYGLMDLTKNLIEIHQVNLDKKDKYNLTAREYAMQYGDATGSGINEVLNYLLHKKKIANKVAHQCYCSYFSSQRKSSLKQVPSMHTCQV